MLSVGRSDVTCLHPKSPHLVGCELCGLVYLIDGFKAPLDGFEFVFGVL